MSEATINSEQLTLPPIIRGVVTTEQIDALESADTAGTLTPELAGDLGIDAFTPSSQNVTIVEKRTTGVDESGNPTEQLSYAYASLRPGNVGDGIGSRLRQELGLPDAEVAFNTLQAQKAASQAEAEAIAATTLDTPETIAAEPLAVESLLGSAVVAETVEAQASVTASPIEETKSEASNEAQEVTAQDLAMRELFEKWGLPEATTPMEAAQRLNTTLESVNPLKDFLHGTTVEPVDVLKRKLLTGMSNGGVYFNQSDLGEAHRILGLIKTQAGQLLEVDGVLPPESRSELNYLLEGVGHTQSVVENMGKSMDIGAVQTGYQEFTQDYLGRLTHAVNVLHKQIEEKQVALPKVGSGMDSKERAKVEEFASEGVKELAAKLRKEGLTPEDIEEAVNSMERYLNDALANEDVKAMYPDLVVANGRKQRKGGEKKGQEDASRRVVAEMAVDMLRGKFDLEMAPYPIVLNKYGRVEESQHRAAALMTLYGKNWVKVAEAAGHKIERKL